MITVYDVISRFCLPELFIIISLLLIFRIIPQNLILGLRSRKTLSNAKIWYSANTCGGFYLLTTGVLLFLFRLLEPRIIALQGNFKGAIIIALLISFISLIICARKINR